MGQRLGIAAALLGDPATLILDEPVNGLDPEGILWVRNLLKGLAAEGRTVFVSSHLMSEMALTAEHLDRRRPRPPDRRHAGRRDRHPASQTTRCWCAPRGDARCATLLARDGVTVASAEPGLLEVGGLDAARRSATMAARTGCRCTS